MGPDVINGLPAHVFLVHIVVIFVPLAALLLILSALWPAARRRLGIITPLVALVAVASIPPTKNAGSWLIRRIQPNPLVFKHAELADGLLPWAIGMFVFAAVIWLLWAKQHWFVRDDRSGGAPVDKQEALVSSTVGGSGGGAAEPVEEQTVVATAPRPTPGWMRIVRVAAVVVALVVSVGSVVEVYRIGDAGAQAAWQGQFSQTPTAPPGQPGK